MGLIDSLKKAFTKPYKTISVAQAKELLGSGATLIDVRSAQEWRTGRAPQAKHVPLDRLQASTSGIQKTRPVIAVCASEYGPLRRPAPRAKGTSPTRCAAAWPPGARPADPSANNHHASRKPLRRRITWLKSPSPKPNSAALPPESLMSARTSKSRKA